MTREDYKKIMLGGLLMLCSGFIGSSIGYDDSFTRTVGFIMMFVGGFSFGFSAGKLHLMNKKQDEEGENT